ncbi:MAG: undecaprenyl-diphosphate phosphatase [Bacillota bacterium]
MTIWSAMLLGLVQGLCEFLPVSSSGHLVLLQNIFRLNEGALFFDTMLHVGTLIAVFIVFWEQIWAMILHPFQRKVGMLLLSTAVTTAIAFLFRDFIEGSFGGAFLGIGFLATAVLLLLSERARPRHKRISNMRAGDALLIGLVQGVAILPGISRSGSTISGGLFTGLERKEAADFSFLLSIPAILGAVVMQVPDVIASPVAIDWLPVLAGMAVAAVSGYFAIKAMLKLVAKGKLKGFAYYVVILGVLVLLDQFVFHLFFANPLA